MSLSTRPTVTSVNFLQPTGVTGLNTLPTTSLSDPNRFNPLQLLGGATGLVSPISNVLTSITGVNVFEELDKVKKYGFSSWGASTTPEAFKSYFVRADARIKKSVDALNAGDFSAINELQKFIKWGMVHWKYMRANHARAKSTKLALDSGIAYANKMNESILVPLMSKLSNQDFLIKRNVTTSVTYPDDVGREHARTVTYQHMTVDRAKYIAFIEAQTKKSMSSESNKNDDSNSDSDSGSGAGALVKLGLGYAISRLLGIV